MWCCFFIFKLTRAHRPSHSWRQRATVGKENKAYYYFPRVQSSYACPTTGLPPKASLLLIMCDHPPACQPHRRLFSFAILAPIQKELRRSLSKPLLIALTAANGTQPYSCSTSCMECLACHYIIFNPHKWRLSFQCFSRDMLSAVTLIRRQSSTSSSVMKHIIRNYKLIYQSKVSPLFYWLKSL